MCDMGNVAIMPNGFSSSFGWAFGVIRLRNRAIIARRFQFCMDSIGRVSRLDDEAVITVYSVMDGWLRSVGHGLSGNNRFLGSGPKGPMSCRTEGGITRRPSFCPSIIPSACPHPLGHRGL